VLCTRKRPDAQRTQWHIKATALIESSFQQILYLDSDNMPAVSLDGPDSVFEAPGFQRLGAMFWPDYWKTVAHNPVWQIIGVQCRDEWEQEAGQMLIDKAKHLDVLRLTEYMLLRYKTWFVLSDGDKDLFRFAMLALRKRWAVPGAFVGSASWGPERTAGYCSHTMFVPC
jgi:alpha 1,2-mannosyltransferase